VPLPPLAERRPANLHPHPRVHLHTAGHEWIFGPTLPRLSVAISVGTPVCLYGIAYRRVYGLYPPISQRYCLR
jgi:hypothetical protein